MYSSLNSRVFEWPVPKHKIQCPIVYGLGLLGWFAAVCTKLCLGQVCYLVDVRVFVCLPLCRHLIDSLKNRLNLCLLAYLLTFLLASRQMNQLVWQCSCIAGLFSVICLLETNRDNESKKGKTCLDKLILNLSLFSLINTVYQIFPVKKCIFQVHLWTIHPRATTL